jgi:predicted phage baseplate assembly protein
MREPEVRLDPRHYQDLVDEARLRVGRNCPEWTDHNVSDPGMTLIDQFAWMTDILLYRVNRIPDRVHEALLNLIGIELDAPTAACTRLRFRLARPPAVPVLISAGRSGSAPTTTRLPTPVEVATVPEEGRPAVVFQLRQDATVPVLELAAAALWRADRPPEQRLTSVAMVDGLARLGPDPEDRYVFSRPPRPDDALYLGFEVPIANLVLQLHVATIPARGTNIDPDYPPLQWDVSGADGSWEPGEEQDPVEVLSESTGGLNYPSGTVELQIPEHAAQTVIGGIRMYWLRCRPRKVADRAFSGSPDVVHIHANAIGVLGEAHHAQLFEHEELGVSDGTAGQTFRVRHPPALALEPGETVQVQRRRVERRDPDDPDPGLARDDDDEWVAWKHRSSLHESHHDDRHFLFIPTTGEVQFGVAIKMRGDVDDDDANRGWHAHGAVPPVGTRLRMSRYRHGGGHEGNVEPDTLTVLRTPIPGVASVTNPKRARGGVDGESLAEAQHRAADQLRMRRRAITREDFEQLASGIEGVARARCVAPQPDARTLPHPRRDERTSTSPNRADRRDPWPQTAVKICVLPHLDVTIGRIPRDRMRAPTELREEVLARLKEWTLVGTSVHVTPVSLREVTVVVEAVAVESEDQTQLVEKILRILHRYLNPYGGGDVTGPGDGWEWGRDLEVSSLRMLIDRIDAVDHVVELRVYETGLAGQDDGRTYRLVAERLELGPHELLASGPHEARVIDPEQR